MTTTESASNEFSRPMRIALGTGLVASVFGVVGLFVSGTSLFFQAYLFSFLFWLGISLGSLALLLLHFTVGSRWGLTFRRIAEAASGSIWLMALLFLPLLFAIPILYPWTNPTAFYEGEALHMVEAKTWYLNMPFFLVRAVIFFSAWILLAFFVNRWSARLSTTLPDDQPLRGRSQGLGAAGLIIYALTMTYAAIDWIMSLEPLWTSTIFGLIVISGQALTALSFALVILNLFPSLSLGQRWSFRETPVSFKDLGAFLLVFVLGWSYLVYFQFLIIWAGNIPREVLWYTSRIEGGWSAVIGIVVIFQFVLPFLVLLSIRARNNMRALAAIGGMLLFTNLVNIFWYVKPAFSPGQFSVSWLDIVMPFAIGGLWLTSFFYHLARRPALTAGEQVALHLTKETRSTNTGTAS